MFRGKLDCGQLYKFERGLSLSLSLERQPGNAGLKVTSICYGEITENTLEWINMSTQQKQRSINVLVIYMITALLFLTSVEIHIHDKDAAATADHGFAVSISSFADDLLPEGGSDEIVVSPDGALKVKQGSVNLLAVFLLIAIMVTVLCRTFIGRLRESHIQLPVIPFHGTPPLRAPPL